MKRVIEEDQAVTKRKEGGPVSRRRKRKKSAKRKGTRPAIAHYNMTQEAIPVDDITSENIKAEFARRLQAAMIERGWNQSELARRTNEHLAKPAKGQKRGKGMGRDSVSHYMRGKMMPLPAYLDAISKALGKRPEELLPMRVPSAAPSTPFEMRGMPDGRVFFRLSRIMDMDTAIKISEILRKEDRKA